MSVPITLKRPGLIAVAPRNAAEIAVNVRSAPGCGVAFPFWAISNAPAKPANDPERTKLPSTVRPRLTPTSLVEAGLEPTK